MSALKRCLSRVADAAENTRAPQRVWILLFVAAWTLYNAISHLNLAITHDTAEAYVWGREFQWGYYKHPPFWAWVAGAWFAALPHNVWAFAALCAGVSGVGLLGVWRLYGALGRMQNRATAIHLSLLTPFYTFFALKYNANDIFLALWPWTAFAFVRSLERTALFYAVWFGVLSALCLLSKYYAVLLLGTCLIAAVIHPEKRTYFSSPRPYITIGVALLLVAPHLYWLVQAGFPSFQYFAEETGQGSARTVSQILSLISEVLLWHEIGRAHV